jgi:hypothetical protein
MTLRSSELAVQRRISRAFIAADSVEVELTRPTRTPDGAGGFETGPDTLLGPQRFRLLPQEDGATARSTAEGETATPEYILMGDSDVDVARWDKFTLGGRRYQVLYIDNRQYEIKAEVIYLGD